jgi:hypothetical protein
MTSLYDGILALGVRWVCIVWPRHFCLVGVFVLLMLNYCCYIEINTMLSPLLLRFSRTPAKHLYSPKKSEVSLVA